MARVARMALDITLAIAQTVKPLGANIWHYAKVEIVPPLTTAFFKGPAGIALEKAVGGVLDTVTNTCKESIQAQEEEERRKIREKEDAIKRAIDAKKLEAEAKVKAQKEEAEAKAEADAAKAKNKAAAAAAKTEPDKNKKETKKVAAKKNK